MVHIVGAGSGAADLITVRGVRLMEEADVVIYAGSLINPAVLRYARPDCALYDSAKLTMEQVVGIIKEAEAEGKITVRLQTGDSSVYGAVGELCGRLEALGISYDVCPGVSAFCGAAASLRTEYTMPEVSQAIIITQAVGRTPVPDRESIRALAGHGSTMVLFFSSAMADAIQSELLAGGYREDTPAAVVYRATWPEEKICRCTVGTLAETAAGNEQTGSALMIVGECIAEKKESGV